VFQNYIATTNKKTKHLDRQTDRQAGRQAGRQAKL